MKPARLLLITFIFFLLANTSYFWLGSGGWWLLPILMLEAPLLLALVMIAFQQLYLVIRYKYYSVLQRFIVLLTILLLSIISRKPLGIINYEKYEVKNLFVAVKPISGNCMISLKLKENHRFKMRSSCINFEEQKGNYSINGDTIIFHNNSNLHFAVITEDTVYTNQGRHYLSIFKNGVFADELYIAEDNLKK